MRRTEVERALLAVVSTTNARVRRAATALAVLVLLGATHRAAAGTEVSGERSGAARAGGGENVLGLGHDFSVRTTRLVVNRVLLETFENLVVNSADGQHEMLLHGA